MEGASRLFSHDVRIVTCQNCGAPLTAEVAGGTYTCGYCSAVNQLTRRDDSGDLEKARLAANSDVSESERIAKLRLQDRDPHPTPAMDFIVDGAVPPHLLSAATEAWKKLRVELGTHPAFVLQERLFFLTLYLAPRLDGQSQRAFVETAIEILDDERYRQILRCLLARIAARNGDVASAAAWLSYGNPRSLDLEMDTAYRYAAATIAIVKDDATAVVDLLGITEGDIPLADRDEPACRMLRIHAKQMQGRVEDAGRELLARISLQGLARVQAELARHAPLSICGEAMAWAQEQRRLAGEAEAEEARRKATLEREDEISRLETELAHQRPVTGSMVLSRALIALLVTVPFSLLWCAIALTAAEADPAFGAIGGLLCEGNCKDCAPPLRAVSWSTTSNGNTSQEGLYVCSDRNGEVAGLPRSEFFVKAAHEDPWLMEYHVPFIAVTFTFATLVFPILFSILVIASIIRRIKLRQRLQWELDAARTDT